MLFRSEQIRTKEQENKDAQARIDELKGEDEKEQAEKLGVEVKDDNENSEAKAEIEEKQAIIDKNNQDIEALKLESEAAKKDLNKEYKLQKLKLPKQFQAK